MERTALVTGATSGIGLAAVQGLVGRNFRVILHGRTVEKCRAAFTETQSEASDGAVEFIVADFTSLKEVWEMSRQIRDRFHSLDVLINNAGCFTTKFRETVAGYELQWTVNHLAPFLLTRELLPLLQESDDGRIVTVSSGSHTDGRMYWEDPNLRTHYNGLRAYRQSKLANVLFSYELHRRYRSKSDLSTYAVEPGLVDTRIAEKHSGWLAKLIWRLRTRNARSPEEGAETLIYTASAPEVADKSGLYWKDCEPIASSPASYNEASAEKLWELSETMVRGVEG